MLKWEIPFKNGISHFPGKSIPFEIHLFSIFQDSRIVPYNRVREHLNRKGLELSSWHVAQSASPSAICVPEVWIPESRMWTSKSGICASTSFIWKCKSWIRKNKALTWTIPPVFGKFRENPGNPDGNPNNKKKKIGFWAPGPL